MPTFNHPVLAVKVQHARIARALTRAALLCALGPVALALVVGAAGALGFHGPGDVTLEVWLFSWLLGMPATTIGAVLATLRRGRRGTEIEVDQASVRLRDERGEAGVIDRAQIRGALHVAGDAHEVHLVLASHDLVMIQLSTAEAARGLVASLGYGAKDRRTLVPLGDSEDGVVAGCWGVLLGVLATLLATWAVAVAPLHLLQRIGGYLIGMVFIGTSLLFARLFTPKRLIIGTDGLLIEGGIRRRFVPLGEITDVFGSRHGIVIRLGERAEIPLNTTRRALGPSLVDRLKEALASARGGGEEPTALVARGGRSLPEWREALRRLSSSGGYRGERVSADALLRAAESIEAPLDQRIGAAMAIGLGEDEEAKARLRIAVEGIANESTRAAMEAAIEGAEEEAAIAEALEAEARSARR